MDDPNSFDGFLFAKLDLIGSKSEGPVYILQQWDNNEIKIVKKVELWKQDPTLHKFLAKKVTILGKMGENGLMYDEIRKFKR